MGLTQVFSELRAAKDAGVVGAYALGGAVAATVYIEPAATEDVDVFVAMAPRSGQLLVTLEAVYSFFQARGAEVAGERLAIGGWSVQLLPPPTPLVEDALASAVELEVEGTVVPVLTEEHLAAISIETNRLKDKLRVRQFLASPTLDRVRFEMLVERFDLKSKYSATLQFLQENE